MNIYFRLLFITLVAVTPIARGQNTSLPAFTLKFETLPSDPLRDLTAFKSPFYLVVKDGEAFLAQTETPKGDYEKQKGTLDIIVRNGIDPATKTFKEPILQVAFRYVGSGWSADRFITEIVVPFSLEPAKLGTKSEIAHPVAPVVFASQATMTSLWQKFSQASIRIIGDPMDVRSVQILKCATVSSNLKIARY